MGKSFYLGFIILTCFFSANTSYASRCELKPDPNIARKHDIRMPNGRLISIVAHTHPKRNDPNAPASKNVPTLEPSLRKYYSELAPKFVGAEGDLFRKQFGDVFVKKMLVGNSEALQHAYEDNQILEKALKSHPYEIIGVEHSTVDMVSLISSKNPSFVVAETERLIASGVLTTSEAMSILSIHLTPGGYLRHRNPDLMKGKQIRGLASNRFKKGSEEASSNFCKKHNFSEGANYSYPKRVRELLLKRLPTKAVQIQKGLEDALYKNITSEMQLLGSTGGAVSPVGFLRKFQVSSGITLNEQETMAMVKEADEVIKWLDSPQCHQSDFNEIKSIMDLNKSVLYNVGAAHLTNFKNYLEAFCRDSRGGKPAGISNGAAEAID